MSLLILNQKVLYLVLLITLLYGLTSANRNITIYVQEHGIDQSECMERNESIPCHTLSYILNEINNTNNDIFNGTNISVFVYLTYSQEITNLSRIKLLVNLYLIGFDNPILDFRGSRYVFRLLGGGCLYAKNITFYDIWVSFYFLATVSFNKCIFTSGASTLANTEGLYIENVYNLTISNCLFHNNDQSSLIVINSALNVEISGCEFYQNEGQHHLIFTYLIFIFDIDNCSIYDNDIKDAIFLLESKNSESMFNITNCL